MIGSTTRAERSTGRTEPRIRCTYCHGPFERLDGPLSCGACGGLLHEGCWYEAARCPTLGCAGPGAGARRRRPPLRPPSPAPRHRREVLVALHVVPLAAWLLTGVLAPRWFGPWPLLGALLGALLLSAAILRGWRLDRPWLLVVSGLALGRALLPFVGVRIF